MTKASRDTVGSPDSNAMGEKVCELNSKPTYQAFSTMTIPASVTMSMGLLAFARFGEQSRPTPTLRSGQALYRHGFCFPSGQFYRNMTNPAHLLGLSHLVNFAWTRKLPSVCRDFAKTHANPDTDGT
jgi:hypothetical protein